jgi:septum formation protein
MKVPLLVLASNSPRRRELMSLGGWEFEVQPANVDESRLAGETPEDYVLRLALTKAQACAASLLAGGMPAQYQNALILGADTSVVDGSSILGKPESAQQAVSMLQQLRGRSHQVFTGIALLPLAGGNTRQDLCVTDVPMRVYSDEQMEAYVATGDPLDKAGGYAIQHPWFNPVAGIGGCYASVMGLPLCHLARCLRGFNLTTQADIAAGCLSKYAYSCPISARVLSGEQVG